MPVRHMRPGAPRGWKRACNPLEMELQVVVASMRLQGIEPRPSGTAVRAFNHGATSPASENNGSWWDVDKSKPHVYS